MKKEEIGQNRFGLDRRVRKDPRCRNELSRHQKQKVRPEGRSGSIRALLSVRKPGRPLRRKHPNRSASVLDDPWDRSGYMGGQHEVPVRTRV